MKTRIAIIAALAAVGVSSAAFAVDPPAAPALTGTSPSLYPSEQGAFKLMEAAAQIVESGIVQNGCPYVATYGLSVSTNEIGTGSAELGDSSSTKSYVNLNVAFSKSAANFGRQYTVTGAGVLDGLQVLNFIGTGSYNIGSPIQEMSNSWTLKSPQTPLTSDAFTGTIIKDYKRIGFDKIPGGFDDAPTPVSTVLDYGYQQVSKLGYVKAKWWQQSRTWRDDGVNSGTYWVKTRVAPIGCTIEIKLAGYGLDPADNINGFNENGVVRVSSGKPVGPFKL
jgi:hypothetical protein